MDGRTEGQTDGWTDSLKLQPRAWKTFLKNNWLYLDQGLSKLPKLVLSYQHTLYVCLLHISLWVQIRKLWPKRGFLSFQELTSVQRMYKEPQQKWNKHIVQLNLSLIRKCSKSTRITGVSLSNIPWACYVSFTFERCLNSSSAKKMFDLKEIWIMIMKKEKKLQIFQWKFWWKE